LLKYRQKLFSFNTQFFLSSTSHSIWFHFFFINHRAIYIFFQLKSLKIYPSLRFWLDIKVFFFYVNNHLSMCVHDLLLANDIEYCICEHKNRLLFQRLFSWIAWKILLNNRMTFAASRVIWYHLSQIIKKYRPFRFLYNKKMSDNFQAPPPPSYSKWLYADQVRRWSFFSFLFSGSNR
jgi:hypothetical protein